MIAQLLLLVRQERRRCWSGIREGLNAAAPDVAAPATTALVIAAGADRKKGEHIAARLLTVSAW
jgi:hypothetical protein